MRLVLLVMVWGKNEWGEVVICNGFVGIELDCKVGVVVLGEVGFGSFEFEFMFRSVWMGC